MFRGSSLSRAVLCLAATAAAVGCARKPASVDVSPRRLVLYGTGHPKDIMVRVLDGKGREMADQPLSWTSSNASVAEGKGAGHITAKKPGRATLTVTAAKVSATLALEIVDLSEISVVPSSLRLLGPPGTSARLEITGKNASGAPTAVPPVAWNSEDPKIAKVSRDGVVSSVSPGKTVVAARLGDLFSQTEVQVQNKVISRLELRPETAILRVNETQKFTAIAYDEKGLVLPDIGAQFSTMNPDLVRMSGDGKATALAKGTAVVSASLGGKIATATVLVD
jgi:uncharacterized protein YjdB